MCRLSSVMLVELMGCKANEQRESVYASRDMCLRTMDASVGVTMFQLGLCWWNVNYCELEFIHSMLGLLLNPKMQRCCTCSDCY